LEAGLYVVQLEELDQQFLHYYYSISLFFWAQSAQLVLDLLDWDVFDFDLLAEFGPVLGFLLLDHVFFEIQVPAEKAAGPSAKLFL
jgi:hypothetical protein